MSSISERVLASSQPVKKHFLSDHENLELKAERETTLESRIVLAEPHVIKVLDAIREDMVNDSDYKTEYNDLPAIPAEVLSAQEATSLVVMLAIEEGIVEPNLDLYHEAVIPPYITDLAEKAIHVMKLVWTRDGSGDERSQLAINDHQFLSVNSNSSGTRFAIS